VCVVAGAVAANRQHSTGDAEREVLAAVIHAVMPGINLVFFTLAGTALHLSSVFNSAGIKGFARRRGGKALTSRTLGPTRTRQLHPSLDISLPTVRGLWRLRETHLG